MVRQNRQRNGYSQERVRYAVIGLGYISQAAMLPAFAHAGENSELTALISDDPLKLRKLSRKYQVTHLFTYEEYFVALRSGLFDALYVALPNSMHAEYTIGALREGIHVLCEKPMAPTVRECEQMISAASAADRKLMIAYRLHFEKANLEAAKIAQSGRLGDIRFFSSNFAMNVKPGDIRLDASLGGGPVDDIGIYCINAARNIFRDEPIEVSAFAVSSDDERFCEVPEMVCATMQFSGERIATFVCSFNAAHVSEYRIVGTKGELVANPAYELADGLKLRVTVNQKTRELRYPKRDQFAPELVHFSDCILNDEEPTPSGAEGLADVRVIQAIAEACRSGRRVHLRGNPPPQRPDRSQEMRKPPVRMPKLIKAAAPSK